MGSTEPSRKEDDRVKHGICGYCKKVAKGELAKKVKFDTALTIPSKLRLVARTLTNQGRKK